MLMIYGLFVFSVRSAPFNERQHSTEYRWASHNRIGNHPAYQYIGKGEETITLTGTLMPEFSGGEDGLDMLHEMAASGQAYLLMAGNGRIFGRYFIDSISDTADHFLSNGTPQKIEFTISLKYYDGKVPELIGSIAPFIPLLNKVF